jgi:hypothetical protein
MAIGGGAIGQSNGEACNLTVIASLIEFGMLVVEKVCRTLIGNDGEGMGDLAEREPEAALPRLVRVAYKRPLEFDCFS